MWLRSPKSEWGWLPARISRKEVVTIPSSVSKPRSSNNQVGADNGAELKDAYGRYRTSAAANSFSSSGGGGGGDPNSLSESPNNANDINNLSGNHSDGDVVQPEHTSTISEEQDEHQSDKEPEQQQIEVEVVKNANENDNDVDQIDGTSPPEDTMIELTLVDDFDGLRLEGNNTVAAVTGIATVDTDADILLGQNRRRKNGKSSASTGDYYANAQPFTEKIRIANNAFLAVRGEEHPDIKLRNIPMAQYGPSASSSASSLPQSTTTAALTMMIQDTVTGGVDDLIGLTHLHEPAILHAIRLRYDADIIYTSTGPILLAINPFKVRRNYFWELKEKFIFMFLTQYDVLYHYI